MSQENKQPFKKYSDFFKSNKNATIDIQKEETPVTEEKVTKEEAEVDAYKPINHHKEKETKWYNGVVTDCYTLNLRKEPSLNAEILEVIKVGDDVLFTDLENNGEWCKIKYGNKIGYSMSQYIVMKEPVYVM